MDTAGLLGSIHSKTGLVSPYPVPLTPVDVRIVKFKTRRRGRRFDMRSVDELMSKISESIDASSNDESRLSSVEMEDSLMALKPARWGQKGYDALEVVLFVSAAVATARRLEGYAVVKQAEDVLAGPQVDLDEENSQDEASAVKLADAKLAALADGFIALGDLTRLKMQDMEREIEDLRRQVNGRLH